MNVADCKENSGLCSRRAPRITICLGYLYHNLLPAMTIALLQLAHTAGGSPAHLSPPVGHSTLPAASGICLRQSYHCHCHPICQVPRFSLLPLLQSIYSSLSRLKAPSVALPHAGQRSSAERNTSGSASLASGAAVGLRAEQTVPVSALATAQPYFGLHHLQMAFRRRHRPRQQAPWKGQMRPHRSALAIVEQHSGLQRLHAALRKHRRPLQRAHVQRAAAVHAPGVAARLPAEGALRAPVPAQHRAQPQRPRIHPCRSVVGGQSGIGALSCNVGDALTPSTACTRHTTNCGCVRAWETTSLAGTSSQNVRTLDLSDAKAES